MKILQIFVDPKLLKSVNFWHSYSKNKKVGRFWETLLYLYLYIYMYTLYTTLHSFNGPFSGTTRVSRYQKGKTNLDFTEARDSEWQWHPLGYMQVCTSLQSHMYTLYNGIKTCCMNINHFWCLQALQTSHILTTSQTLHSFCQAVQYSTVHIRV